MSHSGSDSQRSRSRSNKKKSERADATTCLYIGNIDKRLSEDKLRAAFAEHGELQYCFIVYEPYSGGSGNGSARGQPKQSRGYGFAKYKNPDDTSKARDKMQGADLNGRRITVDFSKRDKPREPTPGKYLGKKRNSPVRRSRHDRKSRSRSYSQSSSRSHKRRRYHNEKRRRHQRSRSRSDSHKKRRASYSKSPRR